MRRGSSIRFDGPLCFREDNAKKSQRGYLLRSTLLVSVDLGVVPVSKCPICATENKPTDRHCRVCGAAFTAKASGRSHDSTVEAPVTVAAPYCAPVDNMVSTTPEHSTRAVEESHPTPVAEPPVKQKRSAWMVLVVLIPLMLLAGACWVITLIGRML